MQTNLYYILDPMCSWCWGFRPVFTKLLEKLPDDIQIHYIMGGLAADSDEDMPAETINYIQQQWRLVTESTGVQFNWDFWTQCQPRRSTYPACRAVIASTQQGAENTAKMIEAIQKAYYLQARNPSDLDTLISLAEEINLNVDKFKQDLLSDQIQQLLEIDFATRARLKVNSFPTILLESQDHVHFLANGQETLDSILQRLHKLIN